MIYGHVHLNSTMYILYNTHTFHGVYVIKLFAQKADETHLFVKDISVVFNVVG